MMMNVSPHSGPGPPPQYNRQCSDKSVTGSSCRALRTAVSALYSVDDFTREKIGCGFFSEVYKVSVKKNVYQIIRCVKEFFSNLHSFIILNIP